MKPVSELVNHQLCNSNFQLEIDLPEEEEEREEERGEEIRGIRNRLMDLISLPSCVCVCVGVTNQSVNRTPLIIDSSTPGH